MKLPSPVQWIEVQRKRGHELCLMLDTFDQKPVLKALLNGRAHDRYSSLYSQTPIAELASVGPFLIMLDSGDTQPLTELLNSPERHWGWLVSIAAQDFPALVQHWRERILVGQRPDQGIYRFHDNRVLGRAVSFLSPEELPAYLGPAFSLCYWQSEHWLSADNPTPGQHPLPEQAQWLRVPLPPEQRARLRETNAHRFLLAHHQVAYLQLAEHRDPFAWLRQQRETAEGWGWHAPHQLELLLASSLSTPEFEMPVQWHPRPHEEVSAHFKRVSKEAKLLQGKGAA
nr:DUF4123 domain-containing protein [uncultured Pseudomonas sp.]